MSIEINELELERTPKWPVHFLTASFASVLMRLTFSESDRKETKKKPKALD